jgi:hypothetical protein
VCTLGAAVAAAVLLGGCLSPRVPSGPVTTTTRPEVANTRPRVTTTTVHATTTTSTTVVAATTTTTASTSTTTTIDPATLDAATESDLLKAAADMKGYFTTYDWFNAPAAQMHVIDPSLDWGGKLFFMPLTNSNTDDTVCLSEQSGSGTWFALGIIATAGAAPAGTYYAKASVNLCAAVSPVTIATWSTSSGV